MNHDEEIKVCFGACTYTIVATEDIDRQYVDRCREKVRKLSDEQLIRLGKKAVSWVRLSGWGTTALVDLAILREEYKRRHSKAKLETAELPQTKTEYAV